MTPIGGPRRRQKGCIVDAQPRRGRIPEKLYDADKYPRMYHLPLFEAPNGLAEALIKVREKMFVRHFMRQQAYNPVALEDNVLEEYATQLAAPGGLRPGIAYFRAHKLDAEHNRENAKTKLPMSVLTVAVPQASVRIWKVRFGRSRNTCGQS